MPGWSKEYYYISDFMKTCMIGAKIIEIKGGFENKYHGEIVFDNGYTIGFHEDSEGPTIELYQRKNGIICPIDM